MPNVTQRLAARGDAHQAGLTTLGPQVAGTVEVRIGNGVDHVQACEALQRLLWRVQVDKVGGT